MKNRRAKEVAKTNGKSLIYYYRTIHNLSQVELAQKLGIDPITLWRYENFKSCPRGEVRKTIASLINKTEGQILDDYLKHRRTA